MNPLSRVLAGFIGCLFLSPASTVGATKGDSKMAIFTKEAEFSVAGDERNASAVAWSPDGTQLAVLASLLRYATVFAVPSGDKIGTITDLVGGSQAIGFTADGQVVIPSHHDDSAAVTIWNAKTGATANVAGPDRSSKGAVTNALFEFVMDPARNRLAGLHYVKSGQGRAFAISIYDAHTWMLIADHTGGGTGLAMSPNAMQVAAINSLGGVKIVDMESGAVSLQFQANLTPVKVASWSADGKRIATGSISGGFGRLPGTDTYGPLQDDNVLQLWDARAGTRIAVARIDVGGGVESLEFSNDGRWLATTTSDGTCRLWDAGTLEPIETIAKGLHPTTAIARFSPDSSRLVVIRRGLAQATIYRTQSGR
ncbi:WD40 repeat domain-containing protein [Nevskia sp.]|uniref:WD40 repeat domain-containing protein n=1 Tax=Nevskia sp. TaxID=1929292 RepID=UPI0025EB6B1E|nr:WD40 repeat domain-containing protein [Nevskia sp.]